jgi:hypothetical protein
MTPRRTVVGVAVLIGLGLTGLGAPIAPAAHADVCGAVGGRHVDVGGCTPGLAGDVIAGAAIRAADPYVPGEIPCYTPDGQPYYTPPGEPC